MLTKRMLGCGLAVVLGIGPRAVAQQFASERTPAPAAPTAGLSSGFGLQPAAGQAPIGYPGSTYTGFTPAINTTNTTPSMASQRSNTVQFSKYGGDSSTAYPSNSSAPPMTAQPNPAAAVTPTNLEPIQIASALTNHPMALKPEHGAFVICVKSYMRPKDSPEGTKALQMAEALAHEIRTNYRTPSFLFEHISDEQKAEMAQREAARLKAAPFLQTMKEQERLAQARGMEFLKPDAKLRFKTVSYVEQFAVMIAGFRTEAEARKALETVRRWPAPKNLSLMDGARVIESETKTVKHQYYMNPFVKAIVVPNPMAPRMNSAPKSGLDAYTIKLNEGRPYNLLKVRKPWTLGVKTYSAPTIFQSQDSSPMRKSSSRESSGGGGDSLIAGATMAEQLARNLREMRDGGNNSLGLDAYVLHTRTGSMVTVGQFDNPDDPALLHVQRLLTSMKFQESENPNLPGHPLQEQNRLFGDFIVPIRVPR